MTAIYLILIIIFSFILIKATDILVINVKGLSKTTGFGQFAVASFIIALATSLPELFVALVSAARGAPNLALGNVIGSNIADLSLIIGGAALIGGGIIIHGQFFRRDVYYAFLAGASPMVLLFDKNLSRFDGLILLGVYGFYNLFVLAQKPKQLTSPNGEKGDFVQRLIRRINCKTAKAELAWVLLGVVLLLFSADMIVRLSSKLAFDLNLPLILVGLIIVALGTSLPELAFELKAVRSRQPEMALGDLLGSIVANGTLIMGLTCLISPLRIQAFDDYLLATMAFVLVFALFYFFIRTKKRLERWEGAALIGVYLVFILLEFFHS